MFDNLTLFLKGYKYFAIYNNIVIFVMSAFSFKRL